MNSKKDILAMVRHELGCNGLKNLNDLAQMRQTTIEKRLFAAREKLLPNNIASIYSIWMQYTAMRGRTKPVVRDFCMLLTRCHCDFDGIIRVWADITYDAPSTWAATKGRASIKATMDIIRDEICKYFRKAKPIPDTDTGGHAEVKAEEHTKGLDDAGIVGEKFSRPTLYWDSKQFRSQENRSPLKPHAPKAATPATRDKKVANDMRKTRRGEKSEAVGCVPTKKGNEVPVDQVCSYCWASGKHRESDCPKFSASDWSLDPSPRPPNSYTCYRCGAMGQHYVTSCLASWSLLHQTGTGAGELVSQDKSADELAGARSDRRPAAAPMQGLGNPSAVARVSPTADSWASARESRKAASHDFWTSNKRRKEHREGSEKGEIVSPSSIEANSGDGRLSPWASDASHRTNVDDTIRSINGNDNTNECPAQSPSIFHTRLVGGEAAEFLTRLAEKFATCQDVSGFNENGPRKSREPCCAGGEQYVHITSGNESERDLVAVEEGESSSKRPRSNAGCDEEETPAAKKAKRNGVKLYERPNAIHPSVTDADEPDPQELEVLSRSNEPFSSPLTPEPRLPIEPYVDTKPLFQFPPYDPSVFALFQSRKNVWIRTAKRATALDLWITGGTTETRKANNEVVENSNQGNVVPDSLEHDVAVQDAVQEDDARERAVGVGIQRHAAEQGLRRTAAGGVSELGSPEGSDRSFLNKGLKQTLRAMSRARSTSDMSELGDSNQHEALKEESVAFSASEPV